MAYYYNINFDVLCFNYIVSTKCTTYVVGPSALVSGVRALAAGARAARTTRPTESCICHDCDFPYTAAQTHHLLELPARLRSAKPDWRVLLNDDTKYLLSSQNGTEFQFKNYERRGSRTSVFFKFIDNASLLGPRRNEHKSIAFPKGDSKREENYGRQL